MGRTVVAIRIIGSEVLFNDFQLVGGKLVQKKLVNFRQSRDLIGIN